MDTFSWITPKVVLIGSGGAGKTTLVQRLMGNTFEKRYISSRVAERSIKFSTNKGEITFDLVDCDGQDYFGQMNTTFFKSADAVIIMYDTTNHLSYKLVDKWKSDIKRSAGDIPCVVCGNKVDAASSKGVMDASHVAMSVKTGQNCEIPFLLLAKHLSGCADLEFVKI